ncbi:DNA repair protein RecN [Pseudoclavibacter chungangensis]|uniref:DNA repair protein RecN n=1 Tax=Pseudoclavibacter chungangensis TaxID=587635 RepID=A0A7J5BQ49_9MICO|nr:DNA repair protein RecN [Pseudoclavibacter chungangensis]KAB1653282.1 DNA repair protein RecN [Pseudoclavibacter chungangensis]NYJ66971.1 DNA repair protein RecN (Recombination protein N) [Pseudoclavibacter chungangensis]
MIGDIEIRGLGVIDEAALPLGAGFTAITGETGAGKTMIVTALGLLLGGRAPAGAVRNGAPKAVVEGRWLVDPAGDVAALVADAGGDVEPVGDGSTAELLVTRQISGTDGRSRAWLGGASVPAGQLAELGERLVVVHGQSDQLRLRGERAQRAALDAYGGDATERLRDRVGEAWRRARETREAADELRAALDARQAEAAELRTLIAAIEPVEPKPGEDAELVARIERVANREELRAAVAEAHALLRGTDEVAERPRPSAEGLLRDARTSIERGVRRDDLLEPLGRALDDIVFAIDDLAIRLSGYLDDIDVEGVGELDALGERLETLNGLMRLAGPTLDDVIRRYGEAGTRLLELDGDDERVVDLERVAEEAQDALEQAAAELTAARTAAATELSARVSEELAHLAMPDALLVVDVADAGSIGAEGADRVSFLLRPHPGASPAPISKAASGGELSRVMLALEVVLAAANPVPTLVFDEVDAGVGGAAAIEIGRRLRRLARTSQVVVVTHLAQVAAFATNHVRIEKANDGEVTTSSIRRLDDDERAVEITRLLSGLATSDTGRAHAAELLALAAEEPAAR